MKKIYFNNWPKLKFFSLSFCLLFIASCSEIEPPLKNTKTHFIKIEKKVPQEVLVKGKIKKNSNLADTLEKMGFSQVETHRIIQAASPYVNFSRLQENTEVFKKTKNLESGTLVSLEVLLSWSKRVLIEKDEKGNWIAKRKNLPIKIKIRKFRGIVEESLWNSAIKAGLDPVVIEKLVQIFAWEIDFNREVLPVDAWRFTIEEKWAGGKRVSWGNILVAEYKNGNNIYEAIRFKDEYYDSKGKSLKKKFLKSPLRFGRITSRFTRRRFHPILKIRRPHYGVDYAAPRGTPVFAVGDGRVRSMRYSRTSGKTISIRHNSYYRTAYKHLSNFHPRLRRGKFVKQGQVIGYVGSTGLSTGPHLHFEFYERGRYVDPLGKKFPQLKKIKKKNLLAFESFSKKIWKTLPDRGQPILVAKKEGGKKKAKDL